MDFTSVLKKALPWIGAAATGNVPALVMMAAKEVSDVLGVDVPPEPQAIAAAVANATPEQLAAMRDREMTFKERMQALGFAHEHEMAVVELDTDKAYLADVADARDKHANDKRVFWLGFGVLVTFLLTVVAAFILCGAMLFNGTLKDVDPGIVAAVFGLLGTVIGYVAANAQQVVGFNFGSSRGSSEKTTAMSKAITQLGDAAKGATP
jgi:hypothetical protein